MRRTVAAVALVCLCAMTYAACNDSTSTNPQSTYGGGKDRRITILTIDSATIQNAGTIHNQGLAAVRGQYNFEASFLTTGHQANYILSLCCGYFSSEGGWDSASYNTVAHQDEVVSVLDRRHPDSDAEVWDSLKIDPTFANNVPPAEVALIDNAISVFALSTNGMTPTQVANRIIARADSLLTIWNATTWGAHEGEASGGFLYIMKSSASYWKDYPVLPAENSDVPLPAIPTLAQVDAAGYLLGWTMAVAEEIDDTGRLSDANEQKRIRAGIRMAITFSFAGMIRDHFNS